MAFNLSPAGGVKHGLKSAIVARRYSCQARAKTEQRVESGGGASWVPERHKKKPLSVNGEAFE